MPNAFITGISGQDGAYLTRLLLDKGYTVWGAVRTPAAQATPRGAGSGAPGGGVLPNLESLGVAERVRLVEVDYSQSDSLARALDLASPDEVYNLAAQSSVARSFETPVETGESTGLLVARLLEVLHRTQPGARFFQASSSEMFGASGAKRADECTPFQPCNPYGAAKVYAHWMTANFRENLGFYACSGVLFNHESPLRTEGFVTRKICSGVARISLGLQDKLLLGNTEAHRDWGFAGDTVEAMHLMLQQDAAQDQIIATGETHSIREFVELAFESLGLQAEQWLHIDQALYRPVEAHTIVADPTRTREQLGWQPRVDFASLVQFLVEVELKRARGETPLEFYPASFWS